MKILEQFQDKIPTDSVKKLAILKKMCSTSLNGCQNCLANFGSEAPWQCSLRRQEPDLTTLCSVPKEWCVPRGISTEYSEKSIKLIIAWFRDLMIYHPDRFKGLQKYIGRWEVYG